MIRRLYVHNFRCLENFELRLQGKPSILLIGNNGAGKTSIGLAIELLQKIARGTNRVREFLSSKYVGYGRTDIPVRFELELDLPSGHYKYTLALELPPGFHEWRVLEETLIHAEVVIFSRNHADISLRRPATQPAESRFKIDWHLAALPIIQSHSSQDPLHYFRLALSQILFLQPTPSLIKGDSQAESLEPDRYVINLASWFTGLLAHSPGAYPLIDEFLKRVMPDFKDIKNPLIGSDARTMILHFAKGQSSYQVPLEDLSDGEKCFAICALVLAANHAYGPLICFWDEPDSHLALSEVGSLLMVLRGAFQTGGQFIATSHNPEAIRRFSSENTFVLSRKSHMEPTVVRLLGELSGNEDVVNALIAETLGA